MQDVCTDAEMLALLEGAQRGEPAAYDRLYNLYADKIFRYLYARLSQRETAEDLTADVFVRLVQTLPRFRVNSTRPVASFRPGSTASPATCSPMNIGSSATASTRTSTCSSTSLIGYRVCFSKARRQKRAAG